MAIAHTLAANICTVVVTALFFYALVAESSDAQNETEWEYGLCAVFAPNTRLIKPGYCDRGVICNSEGKAIDDTTRCTDPKPYYDPKENAVNRCSATSVSSNCPQKGQLCPKNSPAFINDKKSCHGWYACDDNKNLYNGRCPDGLHFDQSKQMCVYPSETTCTAQYAYCDVTAKNYPFANIKNCSSYFQCGATTESVLSCPSGQYFDATLGQCAPKAQVSCLQHPYPQDVCGTVKLAIRGRFVSDGATCRGYYYCKDLGSGNPDPSPAWGQCPMETFFESSMEACMDRAQVKCNEDRCDGRDSGTELSGKRGCQYYLTCTNNYTSSEEKCADNGYYDRWSRECTSLWQSYPACA